MSIYSDESWELEQLCRAKDYLCEMLSFAESDEERERIEDKIDEFAERIERLASSLLGT